MTTELADSIRLELLPQIQSAAPQLGALQSMSFSAVGPGGSDIYDVRFENGSARFSLMINDEGKIAAALFRRQ